MAEPYIADNRASDLIVVAIGASAGGITALQQLFKALRTDSQLAFVVVQHLPPDLASNLGNLIAKWTSMAVHSVVDGLRPTANCVYVPAAVDVVTIEQGRFRTRSGRGHERPGIDTIDVFFESLALDKGRHAIAVVLSGTGMDGTAGAMRIREKGGFVVVQDPLTALYDAMPQAVITRGVADHVLSVEKIAEQLLLCASPAHVHSTQSLDWATDVSRTLDRLLILIREKAGFDLSGYKTSPVLWRIQQRMEVRHARAFEDYLALLEDDPVELETLVRSIPIHVTEFFRDPQAWEALRDNVVRPLLREDGTRQQVRVWTVGCATGEEAYSVAMLLSESTESSRLTNFQVFATDASAEIVACASHARFSEKAVQQLSAERRARFFYFADHAYRVKRSLRETMVFATHDLLADPPFNDLDLVTCRNLLIYLEPEALYRAVFALHRSLRVGGYLFLGKSEFLPLALEGFERVSPHLNAYRKVHDLSVIPDIGPWQSTPTVAALSESAHRAAIEHDDLPSVLVDDELRVLRVYGCTDRILRLQAGEPSLNLTSLARRNLAACVRVTAARALDDGASATGICPADEAGSYAMHVRVTPLRPSQEDGPTKLLISFIRDIGADELSDARIGDPHVVSDGPQDLSEADISRAELEASREELQALNEELKSSNEALNISMVDLHQTNIHLQEKIDELGMQSGVLFSGAVMTIFVDTNLKVRWFTPAVSGLIPLRASDTGRRITDLVPKFADDAFHTDIAAVIQSGGPREAEVRHVDGRWFLRKVHPHLSKDGGARGVAITFTDISAHKLAEHVRRESEKQQTFLLQLSDALRSLSDETAIRREAIMRLRLFFECAWVFYQESDPSGTAPWLFEHDGPMDLTPEKSLRATSLLAVLANQLKMGDVNIADVATWAEGHPEWVELQAASGISAVLGVSLTRGAEILASVCVCDTSKRQWSEHTVMLMRDVCERIWNATARARAESALAGSEQSLSRSHAWLSAQKEAFEAAINGAPLAVSLGILLDSVRAQTADGRRCAFYIADRHAKTLQHVVGMPHEYARCVEGLVISPESLACELSMASGEPVITPDVLEAPTWNDWTWLARDFNYRSCWSFPVQTSEGALVGSLAMYFPQPREPAPSDCELAAAFTETAAIIISRHRQTDGPAV